MAIYAEVSNWKGRCARLKEALWKIAAQNTSPKLTAAQMQKIAQDAITEFNR